MLRFAKRPKVIMMVPWRCSTDDDDDGRPPSNRQDPACNALVLLVWHRNEKKEYFKRPKREAYSVCQLRVFASLKSFCFFSCPRTRYEGKLIATTRSVFSAVVVYVYVYLAAENVYINTGERKTRSAATVFCAHTPVRLTNGGKR